jgi:uncharacterized glyoxalase superfamily protein PhnB
VRRNRSVPPPTVIPVLVYPDVREAVSWLSQVFGFVERTRVGENHRAQLSIGADGAMEAVALGTASALYFGNPRNEGAAAWGTRPQREGGACSCR